MTNKKLAEAYGVTLSAVEKWTPEKREQAKRDIQAGVNPEVARLLGELQRECYVASRHLQVNCSLVVGGHDFDVWRNITRIVCDAPLNPYELTGAIVKVQELYK